MLIAPSETRVFTWPSRKGSLKAKRCIEDIRLIKQAAHPASLQLQRIKSRGNIRSHLLMARLVPAEGPSRPPTHIKHRKAQSSNGSFKKSFSCVAKYR